MNLKCYFNNRNEAMRPLRMLLIDDMHDMSSL